MFEAADWINIGLAGLGVLVAGFGLWVVFGQARQAVGAAEAARDATSEAMQAMAQRVTTVDLDTVRAALRTILDNLHDEDHQSVRRDCQDAREHLIGLRARPGLENQQERLTTAITKVAEAQRALEDRDGTSGWVDVRTNVSDALDCVVELQEHALFFREEGVGP